MESQSTIIFFVMHHPNHPHPHSWQEPSSSYVAFRSEEEIKEGKKLIIMAMEAITPSICSSNRGLLFISSSCWTNHTTFSPFLVKSMASQKPLPSVSRTLASRKVCLCTPSAFLHLLKITSAMGCDHSDLAKVFTHFTLHFWYRNEGG